MTLMTLEQEVAALNCNFPDFQSQYTRVLNNIHYDIDVGELKKELVKYITDSGNGSIVDFLPFNKMTVEGAIAYCLNRGAILHDSSILFITRFVERAKKIQEESTNWWSPIDTTSSGAQTLSFVECMSRIDNARAMVSANKIALSSLPDVVRNIVQTYSENRLPIIKKLVDHYQLSYKEAQQDSLKDWLPILRVISQTLQLMSSSKTSAKTGKKEAKDRLMASTSNQRDFAGDRAAKKVSIQTVNNDLGVVSVSPSNIVGAKAAVVFNVKTRVLEVYHAEEAKTLSIRGTYITNINVEKSMGKTVRDPQSTIPHWCNATNLRRLEVLAESIKGKAKKSSGKLNHNHLILKVL